MPVERRQLLLGEVPRRLVQQLGMAPPLQGMPLDEGWPLDTTACELGTDPQKLLQAPVPRVEHQVRRAVGCVRRWLKLAMVATSQSRKGQMWWLR